MSDFTTYHALGEDSERKQPPPTINVPDAPTTPLTHSVSDGPKTAGYAPQQAYPFPAGSPGVAPPRSAGFPSNAYNLQHANMPQGQLPAGMLSPYPHGFMSPQQDQFSPTTPGPMGSLNAQMNNLNVGGTARKKKDRHAYHVLDQGAGSSQAFNGIPQGAGSSPSDFLNASPMPSPFLSQPVTPAMSQFPAPAGKFMATQKQRPSAATVDTSGTSGRVDPDQIPGVPKSRDQAALYYQTHSYKTMEQHLPPPSTIPFNVLDQGNSSPKYARLTLNSIPNTAEILNTTSLPLGLVLQPLAPVAAGEKPVPVLDFGESGPPRCSRCRTYINPFMAFRSGGNKFVCNMCTFPNDVPTDYFAPTDHAGNRVDREERPELRLGTVEFLVPKEYWTREPVPLRQVFLIDVTQESVNRGFLEAFCDGIMNALYSDILPEDVGEDGTVPDHLRAIPAGAKVAFITFDKEAHFYNCHPGLHQPQMLVMSDMEDPFVPIGSDSLFCDPYESRALITSLLNQLPKIFSTVKNPEPALLPVLDAAMNSLSATGGKIICSLAALPTWGPGRLFRRDDNKLQGLDTEKKLFQTEHPGWKRTADKMVELGVGVDFFIASPGGVYMDLATIGHISATTGGEVFHYPNWHGPRDNLKLSAEVKHTVMRETGYQALMKVRCSNGLQVTSYHGNFKQQNFAADLEFGTIDADKAIGVMFNYDGKLDTRLDAHFQCALLYTTASGERRVRCTNTIASVTESGSEVVKFVDQDAVVCMIAKEAATRMTERILKEVRHALTEKTIDVLASYRKSYSSDQPPGQLVLPENLIEFSMYTLGLLKCRAFKAGSEPSDRRTQVMRTIRSGSALTISLLIYPRILSLHDLPPASGFPDSKTNQLVVPGHLRASFSRIHDGGAYLVSDGQITLIWLHAHVSPALLEDLFGPGFNTLQSLPADLNQLPVLPTHLNAQVRNLLAYWNSHLGSRMQTIQLARQGLDGAEYEFARLLVEDRNAEAQSYVDWLVHVHRGVQMDLSGQRKRGQTAQDREDNEATLANLRAMGW